MTEKVSKKFMVFSAISGLALGGALWGGAVLGHAKAEARMSAMTPTAEVVYTAASDANPRAIMGVNGLKLSCADEHDQAVSVNPAILAYAHGPLRVKFPEVRTGAWGGELVVTGVEKDQREEVADFVGQWGSDKGLVPCVRKVSHGGAQA